jgi:hypothetical protein
MQDPDDADETRPPKVPRRHGPTQTPTGLRGCNHPTEKGHESNPK